MARKQEGGDVNGKSKYRREAVMNAVYEDIAKGYPYSVLVERVKNGYYSPNYQYTDTGAQDLITDVKKMIKKDWEEDRKTLRADIYRKFMDVYKESRAAHDRANANTALREMGKLGGVYEPDKVDVNVTGEVEITFDF